MRLSDALAFDRERQPATAPVGAISDTAYVPIGLESVDRQRHRRGRNTHMGRQLGQRSRFGLAQVVQDAHLMRAKRFAGLRVTHMTCVTSEIDARVVVEDGIRIGAIHDDPIIATFFVQPNLWREQVCKMPFLREAPPRPGRLTHVTHAVYYTAMRYTRSRHKYMHHAP